MTSPQNASHLSLKQWALLFVCSLLFLLPGQFSIPVMDRDEARYAQASRQMIETRDFVDIRFQEQTRYVKPVLTYWLQAASTGLFSSQHNEIWTYRLPSLLGAIAAILITAWLGAIIGGASVGFWAGLLLAASLIVSIEARTAKTDALLLAATTLAQASLYFIWKNRNERKQKLIGAPLVFWLATGIGLLIKGPLIILVSVITLISLCMWTKEWRWMKRFYPLCGLALVVLMIAPWLIMITLKTDGKFWIDSIGHAFLGKVTKSDDSHGMPPGYHLIVYFACFWPASLLTVLQNGYAIKTRKEQATKFLICWLWPSFILFELVVTKLPHYTLPLYPAIAILSGLGLMHAKELLRHKLTARFHMVIGVIFALFTLAFSVLPLALHYYFGHELTAWHYSGLMIGIAVIISALIFMIKPTPTMMIPVLAATALFYALTFTYLIPTNKALWPSYQVAQKLAEYNECDDKPVAVIGYPEPSNVFYLGTRTRLTHPALAAEQLQKAEICAITIVEAKHSANFMAELSRRALQVEKMETIPGINISKGTNIKLEIYRGHLNK